MKTGKRIVSILLVALLLLTAAPLAGFVGLEIAPKAKALAATGQCGDNVYWSFDESTGALTISGSGKMEDYHEEATTPFYWNQTIKSLRINGGVTSIGEGAFTGCVNLYSVEIADSITSIGSAAFDHCSRLKSIVIPQNVTSIGNRAFSCTYLTSVEFPKSVTNIGDEVFLCCYDLKDVYYSGTKAQWNKMIIGSDHLYLTRATIHCTDGTIGYFVAGRDNNGFFHLVSSSSGVSRDDEDYGFYNVQHYDMKPSYLRKLKAIPGVSKAEIKKNASSDNWDGACFGITAAIGLVLMNKLSTGDFIESEADKAFFELGKPIDNFSFLSGIHYLHLLQDTPAVGKAMVLKTYLTNMLFNLVDSSAISLSKFMKELVNLLERDEPYVLIIPDHAVLVWGCIYDNQNREYRINLYDCNSVTRNNPNGKVTTMTVSSDYKKFKIESSLETFTEDSNIQILGLLDLNVLSKYTFEKDSFSKGKQLKSVDSVDDNKAFFEFDGRTPFSIKNVEGKTLTLSEEGLSGDMPVYDILPIVNSVDSFSYKLKIDSSDSYEITPVNGVFEGSFFTDSDYISLNVENADSITINDYHNAKVNGKDISFDIFVPSTINDEDYIEIKGNSSTDVIFENTEEKIRTYSDGSLDDVTVIKYFDEDKEEELIGQVGQDLSIDPESLEIINAPHTHTYTAAVTTEPTCTADGETTYTCSVCGDTYTEPIPATGEHEDADNDGYCDTCEEMMTGGQHCKFCGKIHTGLFGWLIKFFHSILAFFKR